MRELLIWLRSAALSLCACALAGCLMSDRPEIASNHLATIPGLLGSYEYIPLAEQEPPSATEVENPGPGAYRVIKRDRTKDGTLKGPEPFPLPLRVMHLQALSSYLVLFEDQAKVLAYTTLRQETGGSWLFSLIVAKDFAKAQELARKAGLEMKAGTVSEFIGRVDSSALATLFADPQAGEAFNFAPFARLVPAAQAAPAVEARLAALRKAEAAKAAEERMKAEAKALEDRKRAEAAKAAEERKPAARPDESASPRAGSPVGEIIGRLVFPTEGYSNPAFFRAIFDGRTEGMHVSQVGFYLTAFLSIFANAEDAPECRTVVSQATLMRIAGAGSVDLFGQILGGLVDAHRNRGGSRDDLFGQGFGAGSKTFGGMMLSEVSAKADAQLFYSRHGCRSPVAVRFFGNVSDFAHK
jgi:hypothetical protein